eukprot:915767-Rhodomonas_salina.3
MLGPGDQRDVHAARLAAPPPLLHGPPGPGGQRKRGAHAQAGSTVPVQVWDDAGKQQRRHGAVPPILSCCHQGSTPPPKKKTQKPNNVHHSPPLFPYSPLSELTPRPTSVRFQVLFTSEYAVLLSAQILNKEWLASTRSYMYFNAVLDATKTKTSDSLRSARASTSQGWKAILEAEP